MGDQLHVWIVNDVEFVIARDVDDACAVYRETTGGEVGTEDGKPLVELFADDKPFTFDHQDARGRETLLAREWAAKNGRSYFAAEDY